LHCRSITGKIKKKLIIFITALHNKPQSCGAPIASAAGGFTTKKCYGKVFMEKLILLRFLRKFLKHEQ
jgi:hypothetical protein